MPAKYASVLADASRDKPGRRHYLAESKSNWVSSIKNMEFDEQTKNWKVTMIQDEEEYELAIKDE